MKKIILIIGIIAVASIFIFDQTIRYDMWRNIMEEDNFLPVCETDYYLNNGFCVKRNDSLINDKVSHSPKLLALVIESCECHADPTQGCFAFGASWTNGTHRIDNNQCAFISESDGCTTTTYLDGRGTYTIECVD